MLKVDILIVGAGPVGLMCAYLAHRWGLQVKIVDKSHGPLEVGRADALNARSLQLLELADLFRELYPLGKSCDTSSIFSNGQFVSRQSSWWQELEGCFHKHFLMLGQSFIEKLLDHKLKFLGRPVARLVGAQDIQIHGDTCVTTLSNGEVIFSNYVIGADGSRSFVREHFKVAFEISRPEIVWAVIDGVIETDFKKVPEIIVFQQETSDVAWIPREGDLDRFYVRMDSKNFKLDDAIHKIEKALHPYLISFKKIIWFSQFSVKESVAERFFVNDKIFLAGDACHIHSVNGGQGLNTGLGDAFNLIWKIGMIIKFKAGTQLLQSYEQERKPVAHSVVETSGALVRATKFSQKTKHAENYVDIIKRQSGLITGMGIRYRDLGPSGERLYDFEVHNNLGKSRIYSIMDYSKFNLLIFSEKNLKLEVPRYMRAIQIYQSFSRSDYWAPESPYQNQAILVRPDSYIEKIFTIEQVGLYVSRLAAGESFA